jgi:phosphosulfolactate phosphohydrolase-like enzyme
MPPCESTSPSRPTETPQAAVVIVVDVLRAMSTIAQALAHGYGRAFCSAEIDEAL